MHSAIVSPVLVGRTREVEALETVLRTVRQGAGQVVLLAGEAGVGKSRLVAELRRQAALEQWTILAGNCFERDAVFPYAPIIDALRAFVGPQLGAVVADLLGVLAAELVKLLPELTLAIANLRPTAPLDSEAEKRRLFEVLVQFFTRLTQAPRPAPLLLILEDLQWCDETSLDFLHLLARRLAALPVFLLATYRSEEVSSNLRQLLVQLDRGRLSREISVESLSRQDVHRMLQAIFELQRPVRTEFLETIYTLTEGNPFFIEEVLKVLVAAGEVFYADDGWTRKSMQELHIPPSVQDAVRRRTQQLQPEARHLLTLAAVVGRRFDFALLQEVAGRDEAELSALIKELAAAQLVVEEGNEQFAFRHALTRQAVYSGLLGRERQTLHRIIGAASERIYGGMFDPSLGAGAAAQVAELAYHFYEAGEWPKAFDYAWRAGERAQALYAPRAAIEQFTRALQAAQHLAQPPSLISLYRRRGLVYETVGEFEQAHTDLSTALALTQTIESDGRGRAEDTQLEEWQLLLDLGQLWTSRNYDRTGGYYRQALELARRLNDGAASTPPHPAPLARTLNRMGNWYLNVGQPQEALGCHLEALTIFQTLDDAAGLAQTFDLLGLMLYLGGSPVQGAGYLQQAIALFQELDDRQSLASSLTTLSLCGPSYSTDMVAPARIGAADAVQMGERSAQIAQEIGLRTGAAYALIAAGSVLGALGQYGQAIERVQQGLSIAQESEHRQWICFAQRTLGILYRDLLAFPAARRHLEDSLGLAKEIGSLFHLRQGAGYLTLLLIADGELPQAEALLDNVLTPELPLEPLAQRRVWVERAELALAQGNPLLALQLVDRLFAALTDNEAQAIGAVPYLAKLRGEGLVALRRWDEAEATFQSALAAAEAQATPRFVWSLHLALGKLYQAQRRYADAAQAFVAARTVIDEIAASVSDPELRGNFVYQASRLMPTPRPRSPLQIARENAGGLTRREREVALLIAQGKSNRAIAETLILSERTVEDYVTHILAKLGFSARTQIAVWVVEKGLT
ncbi:MAG: AAA family ATPase [Chloroflexi bacterium]|nr:AAA family ATPase [Chloroflexota bacterium]